MISFRIIIIYIPLFNNSFYNLLITNRITFSNNNVSILNLLLKYIRIILFIMRFQFLQTRLFLMIFEIRQIKDMKKFKEIKNCKHNKKFIIFYKIGNFYILR